MRKIALTLAVLGATLLAGFYTAPAYAQATRTWVSGVGDDANPCSRTAPCKTFAGAISKTATNGEIDCLDPGGFGALTITKPITIDCENTSNGGVLVAGTNGINIITTGAVNLIGLDFDGLGPGVNAGINGVSITGGPSNVVIRNCKVYGFNSTGINVAPSAGGGSVVVDDVVIITNPIGVNVNGTGGSVNVTVKNSTISNSTTVGIQVLTTGQHAGSTVQNTTIAYGGTGVSVNGASAVGVLTGNTITGNTTGVQQTNGSTAFTLKNNAIAGNSTDVSGTLTAYPGGLL